MKRLAALLLTMALILSGCSFVSGKGSEGRLITAEFSRAIQIFPGNSVRILGVTVGRVTNVDVTPEAAFVDIRIDDESVKLPADVKATLVPVSLLGERYVQLFPAYEGGPTFEGDRLSMDRTSVPAEQDELLRGMQDYFGAIDPEKVSEFVTTTAAVLDGNGENLNRLIDKGSSVLATLAGKKESLSSLITQLNELTLTLSTRQASIARLIGTYNVVMSTLSDNRAALEGTIQGLNAAAVELASLITETRNPLGADIKSLTRTFRTLSRNSERFVETGKWAIKLFEAASKAVDYQRNWLRLGNQGGPLVEMALFRLQDRLMGVCLRLGVDECANRAYWAENVPGLFCVIPGACTDDERTPGQALEDALQELPDSVSEELKKEFRKKCRDAKNPKKCRQRLKKESEGDALDDLINDILDQVNGTTDEVTGEVGL